MLLTWPAWYLLVWDHLRDAVRALRVDRIESAKVQDTQFRVRSWQAMDSTLDDVFARL